MNFISEPCFMDQLQTFLLLHMEKDVASVQSDHCTYESNMKYVVEILAYGKHFLLKSVN